ncbi:hypothetical protein [Micromonospora haikouensis]|uniref:hypothetical protein n=1 Tax=Micromonospora haikouensis TaxID=686309 RepID=UPI003D763E73
MSADNPQSPPTEGRVSVPAGPLAALLAWAEQRTMPADVVAATAQVLAGRRALSTSATEERLRAVIADALRTAEPGEFVSQVYEALDDAGVILTVARRAELRAIVLREAARLADRVTNVPAGRCTCPPDGRRACGWSDGAGTVAQQLYALAEEPPVDPAPRRWVVPGEPGPDVLAVRDVATGAVYLRTRAGGWWREGDEGPVGAPVTWGWLVRSAVSGLVDVTGELDG